jgi:hypothetical protein
LENAVDIFKCVIGMYVALNLLTLVENNDSCLLQTFSIQYMCISVGSPSDHGLLLLLVTFIFCYEFLSDDDRACIWSQICTSYS